MTAVYETLLNIGLRIAGIAAAAAFIGWAAGS